MSVKYKFASLLLSSIALASPAEVLDRRETQSVKWGPCSKDDPRAALFAQAKVPIDCGTISVPLDWTAPSANATVNVSLVRAPAPIQPAKGSIQINFGGPGIATTSTFVPSAQIYQTLSGGVYDLIAYDPRGTTVEIPFVCATNNFTISQVLQNIPDMSVSERDASKGWAAGKAHGGLCKYQGNGNKTAEYIGTAFMARDTKYIAETLDKDGLIRYWGFSYGSTLGATIAAMFPDKIDRLIIDGIQNAKQYYYEWTDSELWTLNNKVVDYFFESCVAAGPKHCALAAANRTGPEMSRDLYNLIENITAAPIGLASTGTVIDGGALKSTVFQQTYDSSGWSNFSQSLGLVLYGTQEERIAILTALSGSVPAKGGSLGETEGNWGIHCGDRIPRTNAFGDILPALRKQFSESYYVGGQNGVVQTVCAQWPWKAKEVYQGNFEAKTRHPLLVMSNSLDGETPLLSAQNMSAGFEGSVILENDGVGHATVSYPNSCTAKHIANYWVNGTLPAAGTLCKPEYGPFEFRPWSEVFARIANGTEETLEAISAKKWLEEQH